MYYAPWYAHTIPKKKIGCGMDIPSFYHSMHIQLPMVCAYHSRKKNQLWYEYTAILHGIMRYGYAPQLLQYIYTIPHGMHIPFPKENWWWYEYTALLHGMY